MTFDPGSFRDASARVFHENGRVLRGLSGAAVPAWRAVSSARFFRDGVAAGTIVGTRELTDAPQTVASQGFEVVLEHDRLPFVSYPYEWTFGMLRSAALLQLDLLEQALAEGFVLKDASAFNSQWIGPRPVFVDVSSFEPLEAGEPWAGYRQFCEMFLYPLMLRAYRGVPFQPWLRGRVDGMTPAVFRRLVSLRDWLRPGVFKHGVLQAMLQARTEGRDVDMRSTLRDAGFGRELILANVRGLRRLVRDLRVADVRSEWGDYATECSYSAEEIAAKRAFVAEACAERPRPLVFDLGANTGDYSLIVAPRAGYVVSIDADELAVERLGARLRAEGPRNVLPLCINLADPSPGLGWRGRERRDLIGRGRPDLTLCLAVVHHLAITANVPLVEIVRWLRDLGGELVIEFPTREDPMVRRLLRNRKDGAPGYDLAVFETSLRESFGVRREATLGSGTRRLYFAAPRP